MICKFFTEEPSFKSTKQNSPPPPSRRDFTHPPTLIIFPIHFSAPSDVKISILTLPPKLVYLAGFLGAAGEFVSSILSSFKMSLRESTSFDPLVLENLMDVVPFK